MAISLGVPAAERQVFLDGDPSAAAIHTQFQRLLNLARTKGSAIAIGHPHPETLAALTREVPKAKADGVRVRAGVLPADAGRRRIKRAGRLVGSGALDSEAPLPDR